jgi:hypothetical protein
VLIIEYYGYEIFFKLMVSKKNWHLTPLKSQVVMMD